MNDYDNVEVVAFLRQYQNISLHEILLAAIREGNNVAVVRFLCTHLTVNPQSDGHMTLVAAGEHAEQNPTPEREAIWRCLCEAWNSWQAADEDGGGWA